MPFTRKCTPKENFWINIAKTFPKILQREGNSLEPLPGSVLPLPLPTLERHLRRVARCVLHAGDSIEPVLRVRWMRLIA